MKTNIFSKILLVLLSGILILSGIGIGTASASTSTSTSTSTSVSENENVQEPTTPIGIQPAAGSTKVVKVAIKEALNNKAKIVKTARVWIGNDAAK
ncbi:hypothetical protein [Peribacillus sp. NPDC058075]|uniref:hypothetical protein n=1 Tax=unclassified Peribacillus TaxID=2675266 RepID=UPI0036DD2AA0